MIFETPLIKGTLIKRYKRFLTDIELDNGKIVTAHCTNSGSMESCIETGAPVYISPVNDPKRKTKYTWEMIYINNNWVGVNTAWPNLLAYNAIVNKQIKGFEKYHTVKREVKFGDSRFDIYAENDNEKCFVEVKNVTMKDGKYALFPDAVTTRGQKHLNTLIEVKKQNIRAVMLYIVQRTDVDIFAPARHIDPKYAETLIEAINNGVEVIVLQANVSPSQIELIKQLPVEI